MDAQVHLIHLPFWLSLPLAVMSMALRDFLGTMMTVAEARGSERLAGHMDALGDLAQLVCQVVGTGTVILTGINWRSVVIIAAMMVTSDLGTRYWTRYSKRIKTQSEPG